VNAGSAVVCDASEPMDISGMINPLNSVSV